MVKISIWSCWKFPRKFIPLNFIDAHKIFPHYVSDDGGGGGFVTSPNPTATFLPGVANVPKLNDSPATTTTTSNHNNSNGWVMFLNIRNESRNSKYWSTNNAFWYIS